MQQIPLERALFCANTGGSEKWPLQVKVCFADAAWRSLVRQLYSSKWTSFMCRYWIWVQPPPFFLTSSWWKPAKIYCVPNAAALCFAVLAGQDIETQNIPLETKEYRVGGLTTCTRVVPHVDKVEGDSIRVHLHSVMPLYFQRENAYPTASVLVQGFLCSLQDNFRLRPLWPLKIYFPL